MSALKALKSWGSLRTDRGTWLLVHKHGEYEYRNPDSVYIHAFETFRSEEDAREYLDNRIARSDRDKWQLFELVEGEATE